MNLELRLRSILAIGILFLLFTYWIAHALAASLRG
jgi:hypothetical protein